jgi:hypothetical protein
MAMVESGAATSERDAARQIADENGENENTVRQRIKRGKKAMGTPVPIDKSTDWPKCKSCKMADVAKDTNGEPIVSNLCGKCNDKLVQTGQNLKGPLCSINPTMDDGDKCSVDFRAAFETIWTVLSNEKQLKWKHTSQAEAIRHVDKLYKLVAN